MKDAAESPIGGRYNRFVGAGLEAARLITRTVLPPASPEASRASAWTEADAGLRARAIELAAAARIDLLLASTLRAHSLEAPEPLATRAAASKAAAAWAWVEGSAILDALERGGLAPIALKGADLSARAYPAVFASLPDRAYLRHATDLDVLLARPEAAATVMRKEGFVTDVQGAAHHVRWRKQGGALSFSVELHDDLFDRPHGLRHSIDAMRARAVTVTSPDGGTRRVLAPLDAFVHVAGHAVYSDLLRDPVSALRGPIDLAVLAGATTPHPGALLEHAGVTGLALPVALAVHWMQQTGVDVPGPLAAVGRAMDASRGMRLAAGKRRVLANGHAALETARPHVAGPATAQRALLAPSLGAAIAMLREGLRRRRSAM